MHRSTRLLILTAALAVAWPGEGVGQSGDEEDIRAHVVRQAEAWNRHDARAYAALFTERCDVVNVVGWWWKGRVELEQKLGDAFAFVFRDSALTFTDVHVRMMKPDVAIAHAKWTMTGARTPPGIPEPREGIQTLVLTKGLNGWLIDGFQNTNSMPELPFPKGPGVPGGGPSK